MLNENQLEAVEFNNGPCLCLAGPGSGKTTVLVERILSLIGKGVDPERILVITFTKDAAREMKDRFIIKSHPNIYNVTFGTFHSVFFQILKRSKKYQDFTLLNDYKKNNLLSECLNILGIKEISGDYLVNLEKEISYYQNTGSLDFLEGEPEKREEFLNIVSCYKNRKFQAKVLDFDDLLVLTREILMEDGDILRYWQRRFSYFLVDEFQDINDVQFFVLKMLVEKNPCGSENLFVVGDDDQSIYGFRGANPKVMLNFPKEFRNTKTIFLDTNYRSMEGVVMASKRLIDENTDRFYKEYKAFNKSEGIVSCMSFKDETEEGEKLRELLVKDSKDSNKTIGILYRNRSRKEILFNLLKKENLKVYSDDVEKDLREREVSKDVVSFFNMSLGRYSRRDILRIMNKPQRYLNRGGLFREDVTLKEWRDYYPKESKSYEEINTLIERIGILKNLSPYAALNFILKGMGYEDYLLSLKENSREEYESNQMDFMTLLSYSKDFSDKNSFIKDLLIKRPENRKKKTDERISFYTFHGSKGLEFDKVYILDAVEGICPSKNAKTKEQREEERRMFYVAMTRAKEEVVFCVPKKISGENVNPSRFLMESGCDMV